MKTKYALDSVKNLFLLGAMLVLAVACHRFNDGLIPGESKAFTISDGQEITFHVTMEKDHVLDVVVEQHTVDVVLRLLDEDGSMLLSSDSYLLDQGPEQALWIAAEESHYIVEIAPAAIHYRGDFSVFMNIPHIATQQDRRRARATLEAYQAKQFELKGEYQTSLEKYKSAILQWQELGEPARSATNEHDLGLLYEESLGDVELARKAYERGSALAVDSPAVKGLNEWALGELNRSLRRYDLALSHAQRARSSFQQAGSRTMESEATQLLGYIFGKLGEIDQQISHYQQALDLLGGTNDLVGRAYALHNLGYTLGVLGRIDRAHRYLDESLTLCEATSEEDLTPLVLNALAWTHRLSGDFEKAEKYGLHALRLRGDDLGRGISLLVLGRIHQDQRHSEKARKYYNDALDLFKRLGDDDGTAAALRHLGRLEEKENPRNAIQLHQQSLKVLPASVNRIAEAEALFGLARGHARLGNLDRATETMAQALEIVEAGRAQVDNEDIASAFFATKQEYFDFYIDLLMQFHQETQDKIWLKKAFRANERSRARSLFDTLGQSGIGLQDNRDKDLLTRERSLKRKLLSSRYLLSTARLENAEAEARRRTAKKIRMIETELSQIRREIRNEYPVYAELSDPQPIGSDQAQASLLDEETALLAFRLGAGRSFLWILTQTSIDAVVLPRKELIEESVILANESLAASKDIIYLESVQRALRQLGRILLDEALPALEQRRLVIITDGMLQTVPFASLLVKTSDSEEPSFLSSTHEISYIPSASILAAIRSTASKPSRPQQQIAIFADPIFQPTDPRIRNEIGAPQDGLPKDRNQELSSGPRDKPLKRLTHSGREAQYIYNLADPEHSLIAMGTEATRDHFLSSRLEDHSYIHIATHAILDPQWPEASSLVLSRFGNQGRPIDGLLRTGEIYALDLRAELVTLSACQTAQGRDLRGEGIIGWTQGFLYAGAKRVIVSLWSVDDEATAELMRSFYRSLFQEGMTPSAALRSAQEEIRRHPRWQTPYFWAGFVLQGEYL